MNKDEILARIQAGAMNMNDSKLDPAVVAKIQQEQANRSQEGWNLPVAPPKPNPDANINQMIQDHVNQMKSAQQPPAPPADVQQAMQARAGNPINPETGMPSYSAPAAQSPDDAARQQQMQFKMQYLQNKASGGQ